MTDHSPIHSDVANENINVCVDSRQYRLLLVDDEPNVINALKRVFRQESYEILEAYSGTDALELLSQQEPIDLVISDFLMPGMNGAELLKQIKQLYPETIRIMLTGHSDTSAVMSAVNEGAVYKFILKPWQDDDLRLTVALAFEQQELLERNRELLETTEKQRKELETLSRLTVTNRSQLALMLHKRGRLDDQQMEALNNELQQKKEPVLKLILEKKLVDEKDIRDILSQDFMFDEVNLSMFEVDPAVASLLPRTFCDRNLVVPLKVEGRRLTLALADPMDEGLLEDLRFSSGLEIHEVMASMASIKDKIAEIYGENQSQISLKVMEEMVSTIDPFESIEQVIEDEDDSPLDELLRETETPQAVRLANAIIVEAVRQGVSDIHVQPRSKSLVVRYRVDGLLKDKFHIPLSISSSLTSRIKVMAKLNIAERRRPQDGRITIKTPINVVDLRISTLPTVNGEKIVMRILDRNASIRQLSDLGFGEQDMKRVEALTHEPQGIVLVTGPTGSGKTNTLYSLLNHNASSDKNYVTIEDPVEFYMDMAAQVNVHEKIGLTFPKVLRSILRQDPDVALIGEIRDYETAEVAFHAAMTGHLVFSTLHTNSAVATMARLVDLGLKPFIVASAIEGIIAQRLLRRVCPVCRDVVTPDPEVLTSLGPVFAESSMQQVYRGEGCNRCEGSGYKGRIGVFEVLVPDEETRHLLSTGASILDINRHIASKGYRSLLVDAKEKVVQGLTTPEEVLRVLGPQVMGDFSG